ncbi:MAG: hypothetical protein RJB66_1795 [Pseudomonadota bacterium]|jgi:hypothetical protein
MHTLVIPMIIVFGLIEAKARMPPAFGPKAVALEHIVHNYQQQRLVWVNIAKGLKAIGTDCKPTGQSSLSTQILADCLYKIDVAVASIDRAEVRSPLLNRRLTQIPNEFNSIREAIKTDCNEKQRWLRQQKNMLAEVGHYLFSQMKDRVLVDIKHDLNQISKRKRLESLCLSSDNSLSVFKKLISFYESQAPEYIELDRLRTQIVYQIWLMDFLKDQCPSQPSLTEIREVLKKVELLVNQKTFTEYKKRACHGGESFGEVESFECLQLPQTPEALSVLSRMSEQSRSIKSVKASPGGAQ